MFDKRLITKWAKERGLLTNPNPHKQLGKVFEEAGEMASGLNKGNMDLFKDGLGDTVVTLIILAEQMGTSMDECLEIAYNEIKDRTGRTKDGVFIKKEDL